MPDNQDNTLDLSYLSENHQYIEIGNFLDKGTPYITVDFPFILNIPNLIHYRPQQNNLPPPSSIKKYLDKSENSKVIIVTSNIDKSFPTLAYKNILCHPKLTAIITHNPSIVNPKIFSLPLGPKWQMTSILPFGESKTDKINLYLENSGTDYVSAYKLFQKKRHSRVWIRPMVQSVGHSHNYNRKYSKALMYNRNQIIYVLKSLSKISISKSRMSSTDYLQTLQKYRFVISPHGNGLDAHSTWEALMCGCIPIVPSSPLNQIYKSLPVWIVEDWTNITDETIFEKEKEFLEKVKETDFELIFESGLKKYIQNICENNDKLI